MVNLILHPLQRVEIDLSAAVITFLLLLLIIDLLLPARVQILTVQKCCLLFQICFFIHVVLTSCLNELGFTLQGQMKCFESICTEVTLHSEEVEDKSLFI